MRNFGNSGNGLRTVRRPNNPQRNSFKKRLRRFPRRPNFAAKQQRRPQLTLHDTFDYSDDEEIFPGRNGNEGFRSNNNEDDFDEGYEEITFSKNQLDNFER